MNGWLFRARHEGLLCVARPVITAILEIMDSSHQLKIMIDGREPTDADEHFVRTVGIFHDLLFNKFGVMNLEPTSVVVNLCSRFADAVTDTLSRTHRGSVTSYNVERLGGEVAGKCIQMNQDATSFEIIYSRKAWYETSGQDMAAVINSRLVMHELAHALIGRVRYQSGAMDGVIIPSVLPSEQARSIVRVVAEEFWVDWITGTAIGAMGTFNNDDGESRPLAPQDLYGGNLYATQVEETLGQHIYPGWRDVVESYRHHRITLDDMWSKIVDQTSQVFTLLAHADAEQLFIDDLSVLEKHSHHRAVELYIEPVWSSLRGVMKRRPMVPSVDSFKKIEDELIEIGEKALVNMWGKLGLSFEEREDRTFALWVDEPQK